MQNKIRHTYDLHQLLKVPSIVDFFESPAFEEMLSLVGQDDVESFKNNNDWLTYHPIEARIFSETEATWKLLENTYTNEFGNLVYGVLPKSEEVLGSLIKIRERLKVIKWNVQIPKKEYTMKFTEAQLEQAFISLLQEREMTYLAGSEVRKIEFKGMAEPLATYEHIVSKKSCLLMI